MTTATITSFCKTVSNPYVSDRKLALKMRARHARSGKISRDISREGCGVAIYAFGFDELGNTIALTKDGFVKQYIG